MNAVLQIQTPAMPMLIALILQVIILVLVKLDTLAQDINALVCLYSYFYSFILILTLCADKNECTQGGNNCSPTGSSCTNTVGSFYCNCTGTNVNVKGDGTNCRGSLHNLLF